MTNSLFIKKGATIGLCAPSLGCSTTPYVERYANAIKNFTKLGYKFIEGPYTQTYDNIASATAKERAEEFTSLMLNDDVDFIFSVGGGEIMMEILPFIDFKKLKKNEKKKFFMGYSDNTVLTFTLPIFSDTPAIYGQNFPMFGLNRWDQSLKDTYNFITGNLEIQHPYKKCVDTNSTLPHSEDPLKRGPFTLKNTWKLLGEQKDVDFEGRLIGGCLDVLTLLLGTPYGKINSYLEAHKEEGFIWFLESCDLNILAQKRAFWQLKQNGWFKYVKGFLIGRPLNSEEMFGNSHVDILKDLEEFNVPIIYDMDIGHINPTISLIEGSHATVHFEKKQKNCYIKQELR